LDENVFTERTEQTVKKKSKCNYIKREIQEIFKTLNNKAVLNKTSDGSIGDFKQRYKDQQVHRPYAAWPRRMLAASVLPPSESMGWTGRCFTLNTICNQCKNTSVANEAITGDVITINTTNDNYTHTTV